jgi:hypothetical protein
MINEENLRAFMEIEGYSQEQIDEICERLHAMDFVYDIHEVFEAFTALINQFAAAMSDIMPELADMAYTPNPKKKHPRPPRCAGPRNKGRSWTPAPPRVARSNCRRYRR